MVDETQNDVVLIFNLSHDVMVKFRADGSAELDAPYQDGGPVKLKREHQLLLLDALCNQFSFPSPVADVVTHHDVTPREPEDDGEAYTISPLVMDPSDLPPLPPPPGGPT